MTPLKALLDEAGVEYSEKLFNTSAGIAGLGPNPFVSSSCMCGYNSEWKHFVQGMGQTHTTACIDA